MKKRVCYLGLVVLSLCSSAVIVVSSTTAAIIVNLPEKARTQTGKSSGVMRLSSLGGNTLECTGLTDTGTESAAKPPSGEYHFTVSGCKAEKPVKGVICTSSGDSSGTVLVLGTWELVFDKNPATEALVAATLFKIAEFGFECTALLKIKIRGALLCLVAEPTIKKATHGFACEQSGGDATETKYWTSGATTSSTAAFEISFNGGAFESGALAGTGEITMSEEVFAEI